MIAEDLGHGPGAAVAALELPQQFVGALGFLGILRVGLLLPAPGPVGVVAAVMGIPAQHVPQLGPGERRAAAQHAGRQQPRPRAAGRGQLRRGQHPEMRQQAPHPRDALPGGADMPPLPPEPAPRRGQAVIRREDDGAASQQLRRGLRGGRRGRLQDRPANRAVAHIEGEVQVGVGRGNILLGTHDQGGLDWRRNQDKVR